MAIGRKKGLDPRYIIGAVIAVAALSVPIYFLSRPNPMKGVDDKTFCRIEGDRTRTVVILDVTDPLTTVQQQVLKNRLREIQFEIARFDQLDIFVLGTDTTNLLKPLASVCNPGDPSQVDEMNTGKNFIAAKFRDLFSKPLDDVFQQAVVESEAPASPIMEAVQAASAATFDAEKRNHGKVSKKIVLISDMLQNSPVISLYKGIGPFSSFSSRAEYQQVRSSLEDVQIEVIAIPRNTSVKVTDKALLTFWTDFFAAQGATLYRWRNIS